jgi:hypothetical protein
MLPPGPVSVADTEVAFFPYTIVVPSAACAPNIGVLNA